MPTTYNWPLVSGASGSLQPTPTGPQLSVSAIEAAVEAWIVAATGLPAAQVINVNRKVPQPLGSYVEVRISNLTDAAGRELRQLYNGDRIAGSEVELQAIARGTITASLQAHTADPTASDTGAVQLLSKCKTALRLPSQLAALKAAGMSVAEATPVLDLSSRTPGGDGRASMDVRFNVTDSASDFTGYITTVGLAPINTP